MDMTGSISSQTLERLATFGELLRYLRRRAGLTQTDLSIAVGCSDAQISRLEQNLRLPNVANVDARFLPALKLKHEPAARERLLWLAADAHRQWADAAAATDPASIADTPSIAVMPFLNLSTDPGNEYFCDGLAEELLNALTKIRRLFVVAGASAFSFKGKDLDAREIGRRLNVDTILEGSVKRADDRLRVSVHLTSIGHVAARLAVRRSIAGCTTDTRPFPEITGNGHLFGASNCIAHESGRARDRCKR